MKQEKLFESEVVRKCGVISQRGSITRELNVVRFGNSPLKYDLRTWETKPDGSREMRKGLALNEEEIVMLRDLLNGMDLDEPLEQEDSFTPGGFTTSGFSSKPFPDTPGYF